MCSSPALASQLVDDSSTCRWYKVPLTGESINFHDVTGGEGVGLFGGPTALSLLLSTPSNPCPAPGRTSVWWRRLNHNNTSSPLSKRPVQMARLGCGSWCSRVWPRTHMPPARAHMFNTG